MTRDGGYQSDPFIAELYDHIPPYQNRPDIDFYLEMAQESGGPVLELGCGTGRICMPIAQARVEVVGLDLSEYMLDICRGKLAEEPQEVQDRVQLIQSDMRDFHLDRAFSLVITPFRGFQHLLTMEDQLACLHAIHHHLVEEGTFILDIFNPAIDRLTEDNLGEEFGEEPPFQLPDGRQVERAHKTTSRDLFKQINYVELIYYITYPDGREETFVHAFPMRYLFRFEAEHLLVRSGFEVQALYADFDRSPYGSTYPGELIFVCSRSDL
jgi:SAM-dependent methyltransferase